MTIFYLLNALLSVELYVRLDIVVKHNTISIFLKGVLAIETARFKFFSMAHGFPSMIHS